MTENPPKTKSTDAIVKASRELLRTMIDDDKFGPNSFREIHQVAEAAHSMVSTVDPILSLPKRADDGPLSAAPSTEGYGAKLGRELIQLFTNLGGGGRKQSRLDVIKAISYAEQHGMENDAATLREELQDEDDDHVGRKDETPDEKLARATRLMESATADQTMAKKLLDEIGPPKKDTTPELPPGVSGPTGGTN